MTEGSNIGQRMDAQNTALEDREATAAELVEVYGEDVVARMSAAGQLTPTQAAQLDVEPPPPLTAALSEHLS